MKGSYSIVWVGVHGDARKDLVHALLRLHACGHLPTRWSTTLHRKSTCLTQYTLGPCVVQIWSCNTSESGVKESLILQWFWVQEILVLGSRCWGMRSTYASGFRISGFGLRFEGLWFRLRLFSMEAENPGFSASSVFVGCNAILELPRASCGSRFTTGLLSWIIVIVQLLGLRLNRSIVDE